MKSKIILLFTVFILCFSFKAYSQKTNTYTVRGTVINSNLNQPVKDAQVWLYGKQSGDVTDNLGQYEFKVTNEYSQTRLYVRICGSKIATSELVRFDAETLIEADFEVKNVPSDCSTPPNIPWIVNPSESKGYEGHIVLDFHGVSFKTCKEESYRPVWPTDFREEEIWPKNSQFGDGLFIQVTGRLDPYSKGVIPFQNLYVGEIVTIGPSNSKGCVEN